MIFNFKKKHNNNLYNNLLILSRDTFFYKKINLPDTFETRLYLMFMHFSIILIIFKIKKTTFNQKDYDFFFFNIENNLRESGFGDVTVNKKMKDFNKILYDILLKINSGNDNKFILNSNLVFRYFEDLKNKKSQNFNDFSDYFSKFFNFCFEIPLDNMIEDLIKFKDNYGST